MKQGDFKLTRYQIFAAPGCHPERSLSSREADESKRRTSAFRAAIHAISAHYRVKRSGRPGGV
jgi:hypothetical protein